MRRVRNGAEYLSLRTARKRHRCEACRHGILPGSRYVLAEVPPRSELGNDRWWRIPVCEPCGRTGGAADQLFGECAA